MAFIRFVVDRLDPQSGRRQGLFQAGADLLDSGTMSHDDRALLEQTYAWFTTHLDTPARLTVSRHPRAKELALSWFRDSATECITRMRTYQRLLTIYGYPVTMLRTTRPGYIVYEDQYQVAAYPFADTPC